jgi:hypothetical protein
VGKFYVRFLKIFFSKTTGKFTLAKFFFSLNKNNERPDCRVLEIFLVVSDIRTDNLQDFVSPNKLLSVRTFLNKTLYMY